MDRRDNMSTYLQTGMEKVFVGNEKKTVISRWRKKIIQQLYYAETKR